MHLKTLEHRLKRLVNSGALWVSLTALPGVVIFLNRFLIPDTSTDTISYHLFNGLRGLRDPYLPFLKSEFYPVGLANLSPGYDAVNSITRTVLGYRLGTLLSLVSYIGIALLLYKLIILVLAEQKKVFNFAWGLLLVSSGIVLELYFQLATYFVDIMNAFLVLLVLYLIIKMLLRPSSDKFQLAKWIVLSLSVGILFYLKFTNISFCLPFLGLLAYEIYRRQTIKLSKRLLYLFLLILLFILPLLPLFLKNYAETHNPVFPFYNQFFKSIYIPTKDFSDKIFGAHTLMEKLFWPIYSLKNQMRLGEPHHIYNDYKLIIYWASAVFLYVLMIFRKIKLGRTQNVILGYFMSSILIWSLLFGINRYIISSICLGGVVMVILIASLLNKTNKHVKVIMIPVVIVACSLLLIECYRVMSFNFKYDMSWRPTFLNAANLHKDQFSHIDDKYIALSPSQTKLLESSDILLNCHTNVAGFLILLPNVSKKPVVNIISEGLPHYSSMSNNKFYEEEVKTRLVKSVGDKKTFSWATITSTLVGPTKENCLKNITTRGGVIDNISPIESLFGMPGQQLELVTGSITFK